MDTDQGISPVVQGLGKSAMRVAKNSIKGYSDVQTKVRDATSNDPWGPSGTQMSEIAALTFNQNDFVEIIEMLDKRLNDKGKNWRHVFKSLTLLDYILNSGSENVVMYFRENMYIVKTLKEFQYIDEYGKDQGANVRQKAKDITNLLLDEKRMRESRKNRGQMNDRLQGREDRSSSAQDDHGRRREGQRRAASVPAGGKDKDLAAAIAASEASAREEASRGRRNGGDAELEEAMRLSREEDEARRRALAGQSGQGLFDEQQQSGGDTLIDFDTPVQQPMQTGFQSFNPYALQQQQQQEEWARQQQMMELQRQADEQAAYQNMLQQQAYAQQQQMAQEEYMRQQQYQQQMYLNQQQQQQPLVPQPTAYGSNNPFAAFSQPTAAATPPPLPQSNSFTGFQQQAPVEAAAPPAPSASAPPRQQRPPRDDGKHAELAKMLAGGREDGLDTFGNFGNLRVPVGQQFATKTGGGAKPNPFGQGQQQQQSQQQPPNPFFDL